MLPTLYVCPMEQYDELSLANTWICCFSGEEIIIYALLSADCGPFAM